MGAVHTVPIILFLAFSKLVLNHVETFLCQREAFLSQRNHNVIQNNHILKTN